MKDKRPMIERPLANAAHRAERWSGAKVHRNRKKYTRKGKERFDARKKDE